MRCMPDDIKSAVSCFLTETDVAKTALVSEWHAQRARDATRDRIKDLHRQCTSTDNDLTDLCKTVWSQRWELVMPVWGGGVPPELQTLSCRAIFGPEAHASQSSSLPEGADMSKTVNVVTWIRQITSVPWQSFDEDDPRKGIVARRKELSTYLEEMLKVRRSLQNQADEEAHKLITRQYIRDLWPAYHKQKEAYETVGAHGHRTRYMMHKEWCDENWWYGPEEATGINVAARYLIPY